MNPRTPIHFALIQAAKYGHYDEAQLLLNQGADPYYYDAALDMDVLGATAQGGSIALLKEILDRIVIDAGSDTLNAAFGFSLSSGFPDLAELLLLAGAELRGADLDFTIGQGQLNSIQFLIQHKVLKKEKAIKISTHPEDLSVPLWMMKESLLDRAFYYSAMTQQKEICQACLQAGVALNTIGAQDASKEIAMAGWSDLAALMLERGFKVKDMPYQRLWEHHFASVLMAFEQQKTLKKLLPSSSKIKRKPRLSSTTADPSRPDAFIPLTPTETDQADTSLSDLRLKNGRRRL